LEIDFHKRQVSFLVSKPVSVNAALNALLNVEKKRLWLIVKLLL